MTFCRKLFGQYDLWLMRLSVRKGVPTLFLLYYGCNWSGTICAILVESNIRTSMKLFLNLTSDSGGDVV